jgi:hypothetical protein
MSARRWTLDLKLLSLAAFASIFVALSAAAQPITPAPYWTDAVGSRPAPSTSWISRSAKTPCPVETCAQENWHRFLAASGLFELSVPSGGRSYRWLWIGTNPNGPLIFQVPTAGFVEVVLRPDGDARIRSSWRPTPIALAVQQLKEFEAALAKTSFANLPAQSSRTCLDECQDQIMEAVVNGRYHYVARDGGIRDPGIRDAGLILEKFAPEP